MITIQTLEAHIEELKAEAASIEKRLNGGYVSGGEVDHMHGLHQDIGMFSHRLARMKEAAAAEKEAAAAEAAAAEAAAAEAAIPDAAPEDAASPAQASYISALRADAIAIIEQVTPDALALHVREQDANATGRETYAATGDRKAQRAAVNQVLDIPHTEWIDEAKHILDTDLKAWERALHADTSTLTKDEASDMIDLLLTRYPATSAHPSSMVHPEMPEWGNILLAPERINNLR